MTALVGLPRGSEHGDFTLHVMAGKQTGAENAYFLDVFEAPHSV